MQSNILASNQTHAWLEIMFQAKSVQKGGIVRRAVRDIEREIGRYAFIAAICHRRFHLVECKFKFIVIYNPGLLQVIC